MLLTEARVLLLYDPTRGVDVGTKGEIFQLMRDLAAKGYAILFYSSDLPELVHVADRVLVMRNGAIAAMLEGDRISEEGILGGHVRGRPIDGVGDAGPIRGESNLRCAARRVGKWRNVPAETKHQPAWARVDWRGHARCPRSSAGSSTARRSSSPA